MADCFPPEADDLHRRWLPREIFADIGIVDTDAASDAPPEAAAATGVEELAAQLAGILGGGTKVRPVASPPKPTQTRAVPAPCHGAQVCGLEGRVVAAYGRTNGVGVGGAAAAVSWPFVPYQPVQWQGATSNLVNLGGVLDYYYYSAQPCRRVTPPPANLRGGTGVFLPRAGAYRTAPAPAKGGTATRAWPGTGTGTGTGTGRPATGRKQEWQQNETMATQAEKATAAACARPELALPKDWSYR